MTPAFTVLEIVLMCVVGLTIVIVMYRIGHHDGRVDKENENKPWPGTPGSFPPPPPPPRRSSQVPRQPFKKPSERA